MEPLKKKPRAQIKDKSLRTKSIVYFSRFKPSLRSGGGSRRVLQVMKLIRHYPFILLSSWRRDGISKEQNRKIKQDTAIITEYGQWPPAHFTYAHQLGELAKCWSAWLPQFQRLRLLILDDPVYFPHLIQSAAARNLPVIAVCHNLESIAMNIKAKESTLNLLESEIRLLRKCNLVITISREEQVLLINLGINAFFLPYYPVEPIRRRMWTIREKRKTTSKRGILLLGNTSNDPTLIGMKKVLEWWKKQPKLGNRDKLFIAGFNTAQSFSGIPLSSGIEMRGELSDMDLDHLLAHIKGAICYQESGGGALTKINEFLIGGIPVLANFHAARSHHNFPGLFEFKDLPELKDILTWLRMDKDPFPPPAKPNVEFLRKYIKEVIS